MQETTMSIQNPGDAWFWHPEHAFDSAAELFRRYLATVGRGAHWILNLPPNTTGVIPEEYVHAVTRTGTAIRNSFGTNVGRVGSVAAACDKLSVVVKSTGVFDTVMLREDLTRGQTVLGYSLEQQRCGTKQWLPVTLNSTQGGQTVRAALLRPRLSCCGALRGCCS